MTNVSTRRAKKSIAVFGAGVAGLTAAHELVERGFDVEVIDPDVRDELHAWTRDRGIGGMARSQWAWRYRGTPATNAENEPTRLRGQGEVVLDEVIVFDDSGAPADPAHASSVLERLARLLEQLTSDGPDGDLVCMVAPRSEELPPDEVDPRVAYVRRWLGERLAAGVADQPIAIHPQPRSFQLGSQPLGPMDHWLFFELSAIDLFPAEHGFRFFPSFYRHLFDTLRKIPILNPRAHERAHTTVMDNLVPCEGLGFARSGDARSFMVPRSEIKSVEMMQKYVSAMLRELGYTSSDMERFSKKLVAYMTSSRERREEWYEKISWSTFVDQASYSEISRRHIEYGPQMLAALRGSQSDARTQGSITIQLLMDQLRSDGRPDCTLNGPTNTAWLDHWHDYLVQQGVRFRRGTLTGFGVENGAVVPLVDGVATHRDHYVLALSLPAITEVAQSFLDAATAAGSPLPSDNDFARILAFTGGPAVVAERLEQANPDGPLQHLSGIQFYFDVELDFWRGHTEYLDSEWGLTSIAQPQFWGRRRGRADAYRSVLSVDIGIWDRPHEGKTAWECSPDEIATLTWKQIVDHHNDAFHGTYGDKSSIPTPIAYAIDANIDFDGPRRTDKTPFLVNRVNAYRTRPGRVRTEKDAPKRQSAYDVHLGQYVLAGTYLQTYTRLTSMEGANESARHAVNAILESSQVPGDHCAIWDPEDHELPDLQWLKELDARLALDHRRHLIDILDCSDLSAPSFFRLAQTRST